MRMPLALLPLVIVLTAACGPAATTTGSPSPVATPSPAVSPSAPPSAAPSATASPAATDDDGDDDATVMVADSEHGEILVDAEGRSLYLFTPDEGGEPTCYDDCATNWPPLLADDDEVEVGEGLDDSDFSTVTRTDGGEQVRVGDWPLYYFAADEAPGDTNGQGVGGVWFLVSPEGEAIR